MRAFVVFFLIAFLVFNWNKISWIFSYRAVSDIVSRPFASSTKKLPQLGIIEDFEDLDENNYEHFEKENSIEIPKIYIDAPLIFIESHRIEDITRALDFGAVHFPDSVFPGQKGRTIILGHSAPAGWPKIRYDWIFTDLNELVEGDKIYVYSNNRKYEYAVTRKIFLERGEEISDENLTNEKNVIMLISCWPPGKDLRRIAIEAVVR